MKLTAIVTRGGAWGLGAQEEPPAPAAGPIPEAGARGVLADADWGADDGPFPTSSYPWPRTAPKRAELLEPHEVAWLKAAGLRVE